MIMGSWCVFIKFFIIHVIKTGLLKSDVSGHFKAYSSHRFPPTCIRLGSLRRGNRCVLPIISEYQEIGKKNVQIFKVVYFPREYIPLKKIIKFIIHFFFQKEIIEHTYICTKCNGNFKFSISLKSYKE